LKHFLLTVDVEDWFQVENLRPWYPMNTWSSQQPRVEQSTQKILDLLASKTDQHGKSVQATFFVLGWVARHMPQLVRRISQMGHEVASHGDSHCLCAGMRASDLRKDLVESRKLLEDILGSQVRGYRAPSFSISWDILELIREAGYEYDASYNSFSMNSRYGRLDVDKKPRKGIALDLGSEFFELPLSNLTVGGRTLPCSGGGFFRLLPEMVFKKAVQRILNTQGAYHFYMHPWEADPGQPRQNQIPMLSRFRHYVNLYKTLPRLENLLDSFSHCRFTTCSDYLRQAGSE
jgi:polysaccharide deacetylase family protein (PEP-CTERM system associated)